MVSVSASTMVAMSAGVKSSTISAMSTGSASQPTDVKVPIGDAYQRAVAKVRIGNFNMGISQLQLSNKRFIKNLVQTYAASCEQRSRKGILTSLLLASSVNTKKVCNVRILISLACLRQPSANTMLQRSSRITQSYSHPRMIRSHRSRGLNCGETNRGPKIKCITSALPLWTLSSLLMCLT